MARQAPTPRRPIPPTPSPQPNMPNVGWSGGQSMPPGGNMPGVDWMGGASTGGGAPSLGSGYAPGGYQPVPTLPPEIGGMFPYNPATSIGSSSSPSGMSPTGTGQGYQPPIMGSPGSLGSFNPGTGYPSVIGGGGGGGFPYDPMMGWRGRGSSPHSGPLGPVYRPGGATGGMYPLTGGVPGVGTHTPYLPPWTPGQQYNFPTAPGMSPSLRGQNMMTEAAFGQAPMGHQTETGQIPGKQAMPHQTPEGQIPGRKIMPHQTPEGQIPPKRYLHPQLPAMY